METYGSDKPDLRYGLPFHNVTDRLQVTDFRIISAALAEGGVVIGLCVEGKAGLSRKEIGEVEDLARASGLQGVLSVKVTPDGFAGALAGKVADETLKAVANQMGAKPGDLMLLAVGKKSSILKGLGVLRRKLGGSFQAV